MGGRGQRQSQRGGLGWGRKKRGMVVLVQRRRGSTDSDIGRTKWGWERVLGGRAVGASRLGRREMREGRGREDAMGGDESSGEEWEWMKGHKKRRGAP